MKSALPIAGRAVLLTVAILVLYADFTAANLRGGAFPYNGRRNQLWRSQPHAVLSTVKRQAPSYGGNESITGTQGSCYSVAPETKAAKKNVWAPLTDLEVRGVVSWLFQQHELNLTKSARTFGNASGNPFGNGSDWFQHPVGNTM